MPSCVLQHTPEKKEGFLIQMVSKIETLDQIV
jgi:hypothetical protein